MRAPRIGVVLVAILAWLLPGAGPASAADECRGLPSCIPVPGPWVVIPAPSAGDPLPTTLYELRCPPPGGLVGGIDARVSNARIDLTFFGALGSPVSPGITTTNAVLFQGVYTGRGRAPTTFQPFIGCIPAAGGGRSQTFRAPSAVRPGRPTTLRVRSIRLRQGRAQSVTHGCRPGERLLSSSHALGFYTRREPEETLIGSARITRAERPDGMIAVRVVTDYGLPPSLRAELQIHAVCARGGRP